MSRDVPTYSLYGEVAAGEPGFWLHCETIHSRSSQHQWEIRPHRHENFFQILYIEAGSGDATLGDQDHPIRPPTVITVPPRLRHGFRFSRDIEGIVVTILNTYLVHPAGGRGRLGEWMGRAHITRLDADAIDDDGYLMATLRRLGEETGNSRTGRNEMLASYVTIALQLTARISHRGKTSQVVLDLNERRLDDFNELLATHLRLQQPVSFYAEALGISPTHLNRIAKSLTGRTTHELISERLFEEAKRELVFTLNSVQEISCHLGFADPAYFSRFFLRYAGEAPRAWRERERATIGAMPPRFQMKHAASPR